MVRSWRRHRSGAPTTRTEVAYAGRSGAYGEHRALTPVDRFGVWLSAVAVRRHADFTGARVGDFGCGFEATLVRSQLASIERALLVDFSIADDLKRHPRVDVREGSLPDVLP